MCRNLARESINATLGLMDIRKLNLEGKSDTEVQEALDNMDDCELAAAIAEGESRDNQTMLYPLKEPAGGPWIKLPNYPYWTETYAVEARKTNEFLGHVGRLGGSNTWEYDTGLPVVGNKGRAKGKNAAVMRLAEIMGVAIQ